MSDVEEGIVDEKPVAHDEKAVANVANDDPQLEELFKAVDEYSEKFLAFRDQRRYALEEQRWVLQRLRDVMVRTVENCESALAADLLPGCLEELRIGFNLLESRFRIDSEHAAGLVGNNNTTQNTIIQNSAPSGRVQVFTKKRPSITNNRFAKRSNFVAANTFDTTRNNNEPN